MLMAITTILTEVLMPAYRQSIDELRGGDPFRMSIPDVHTAILQYPKSRISEPFVVASRECVCCEMRSHELKIPRPDFGLAFQDRKNATITKSSLLTVLVVIEIASLSVIDEINIFLAKLRNLFGLLGDF